jgi:hypothetical protein
MLDSEARRIAAQAWAQVKPADDPDFRACAPNHQSRLAYKAQSVAKTGTREDAFDEAVFAILNPPPQVDEPAPLVEVAPAPKAKSKAKPKTTSKAKAATAKK